MFAGYEVPNAALPVEPVAAPAISSTQAAGF